MTDTVVLVMVFGLIIIFIALAAILFCGIEHTWADYREGDRIKKKMDKNRLEGLSADVDRKKWFSSLLTDKLEQSIAEFRKECKEEGRRITKREEAVFKTGLENGVVIMKDLLKDEILPMIRDDLLEE